MPSLDDNSEILKDISIVIGISSLSTLLFIILSNLIYNYWQKKLNRFRLETQSLLVDWMVNADDETPTSKFRSIVSQSGFWAHNKKEILYEETLSLFNLLMGEEKDKIRSFFFELNLQEIIHKNLTSGSWHRTVQMLNDSVDIGIKPSEHVINKLISHPRRQVRLAAIKADISRDQNLNVTLQKVRHSISLWEVTEIVNFIQKSNFKNIVQLDKLLASDNNSIIIIALILARVQQNLYLSEQACNLLNSDDWRVKESAIEYLAECGDREEAEYLKDIFMYQVDSIQRMILRFFELQGTDEDIPFLTRVINISKRKPVLQILAAYCLHKIVRKPDFLPDTIFLTEESARTLTNHVLANL